jgi:hypothetical protein
MAIEEFALRFLPWHCNSSFFTRRLGLPHALVLIYNASVHVWNLTRRLVRAGSARYLCQAALARTGADDSSQEAS